MVRSSILGYPRMGPARELKKALEKYWSSQGDERALLNEAARVRALHWKDLAEAGIDFIPSGDFSLYDHVLDTAAMLGAFPERYGSDRGDSVTLLLFRHGPGEPGRGHGPSGPGNDEVVRHKLPLHSPRGGRAAALPPVLHKGNRPLRGSKGTRRENTARASRPCHLPVPCQAVRREDRSAVTARRRASGL